MKSEILLLIYELLLEIVHPSDARLEKLKELIMEEIVEKKDGTSHYHRKETQEGDDVFEGKKSECPFCEQVDEQQ
jgi:hypothetical protein